MPSKLCPHSLYTHPDLTAFVKAGCPLVKLATFFGPADELLALNPNLTLIGRIYEPYDANAEARSGKSPETAARELVDRQKEQYRLNPSIKVWEGPNEPVFGGADDPANVRAMAWYATFEVERLRLLADLGLQGVVGNFSTGTPDLPMWPAFLPALAAAKTFNGYLGLHEYSSPWMWWLTGNYQTRNCENRPDFVGEDDTGFVTLRYRKAYRNYLIPNGLGDVPLIMTECGLDGIGVVCPGQTSGAWRVHPDFWKRHDGQSDPIDYWRGPERDLERYYAEQLIWYDSELQKDSYVAGATIFTVGNTGNWQQFEIGGTRVTQYLVDYIRSQRDVPSPKSTAQIITPTAIPTGNLITVEPTPSPAGTTVVVPPGPEPMTPREPAAPSLLSNTSFEEGLAYFYDNTRELAVPVGWALSFYDETTPSLPQQTAPFGRPITALINPSSIAAADRDRIFVGGTYCWKVGMTRAPVWIRLFQGVGGVEAGKAYRLTLNILPDLIVRTHPQIAYHSDPLAGEVQLTASFPERTFDTGWKTGRDAPFGKYTRLTLDFIAPSDRVEVAVEVRGRWALSSGAWYIDELSLSEG